MAGIVSDVVGSNLGVLPLGPEVYRKASLARQGE